jgi:hypothetical protein
MQVLDLDQLQKLLSFKLEALNLSDFFAFWVLFKFLYHFFSCPGFKVDQKEIELGVFVKEIFFFTLI